MNTFSNPFDPADPRFQRAAALAALPDDESRISERGVNQWTVKSATSQRVYFVQYYPATRRWTCTCPDREKNQALCYHVRGIRTRIACDGWIDRKLGEGHTLHALENQLLRHLSKFLPAAESDKYTALLRAVQRRLQQPQPLQTAA